VAASRRRLRPTASQHPITADAAVELASTVPTEQAASMPSAVEPVFDIAVTTCNQGHTDSAKNLVMNLQAAAKNR